ncbi:hypothetical protein PT286_03545 [Neisseriaceae bacterium ESL0693]|nr:hypothetical protein [Neisseriaceae bacterium ESL0693]
MINKSNDTFNNKKLKFLELEKEKIYPFLKKEFYTVNSMYLLGVGIDQESDIYTYLVNKKYVIEFDLSRIDGKIVKNEIISLEDYEKSIQGKGVAKKRSRDYLKSILNNQ